MFKRLVTIVTILAISTFFTNWVTRANLASTISQPPKVPNRSCPSCVRANGDSLSQTLDRLALLGRRTQIMPFAPVQRSTFIGAVVNFVSTATGNLTFSVTDLSMGGSLPISFQRVYASDRRQDTGLGSGWSFIFDDRITLSGDTATLSTGAGSVIAFRREGQGQKFVRSTTEEVAHDSFELIDDETIVESTSGFTRTYKRLGPGYRLARVADSNGNAIVITFNSQGQIDQIAGGGGTINLKWSEGRNPRLLSAVDSSGRRIGFTHDASGLRSATDSAGAEWNYDYQAGLLTRATDPLKRVLLRARYDKAGHVIESGDAAGVNRYAYEFSSGGVSRRTIITDPLGATTAIEHTGRGALASVGDDEGQEMLHIEYDGSNRATRITDTLRGETVFRYDSRNRVTKQSSTGGLFQEYTYDERGLVSSISTDAGRTDYSRDSNGNITLATSNDPAQSYQATRNPRGQLTRISSQAGSDVSLEHDAAGNTSAFTTNGAGRFELEYDSVGNVTSRRLPSGALYKYNYDARGVIAKQIDNRDRSVTFERDASGVLSGFSTASGEWVRATRDQAGRITSLRTSAGKSRRFAYDARGALTEYTDARGKNKRVGYDRRGRVHTIDDDYGNKTVIERDKRGRIASVSTFRGKNGWHLNGKSLALTRGLKVQRFAPVVFNVAMSRIGSSAQWSDLSCLFDGSDDFMDPNSFYFLGNGCSDPFGGFGSDDPYGIHSGGNQYFDPFFGFGPSLGETCEQCKARQQRICELEKSGCNARATAAGTFTLATCVAGGVFSAGIVAIFCLGTIFGGAGLGGLACDLEYRACLLKIVDKCPQC